MNRTLLLFFLPLTLSANDTLLTLENQHARFTLKVDAGRLYLASAENLADGASMGFGMIRAFDEPTDTASTEILGIRRTRPEETAYRPAHQRLEITQALNGDTLIRRFELYDGTSALRGTRSLHTQLPDRHWEMTTVRFADQTDHHNDLVHHQRHLLFNGRTETRGNVLLARPTFGAAQLWLLKEAPLGTHQLDDPGYDFAFSFDELAISADNYGWVLGISANDRPAAALEDLRRYQLASYTYRADRDEMVMMNTWGDRGQDGKVNEAFVLDELHIAAAMGITHFQIDDGWQAGLSQNSASPSGQRWRYWEADDWQPHPERFPNGLAPVVARARELGMEVGLWFNASSQDDYASWRRDADILVGLYRDHGIRTFKMDGLNVPDTTAEANLRGLFERVREGTEGNVLFNLDVTADRRGGYFYLTEYGNIFLENRYTDWGKYYPHWTLRNLWQLAHYVPPAKLQVEFLNPTRNFDQYPDGDALAPRYYSFDYLFASTAVAQPLAWMEGSSLPDSLRETRIIHQLTPHLKAIHSGITLPIGEEPDGTSWTGFQTRTGEGEGYFLVFRELNDRPEAFLPTHLRPGTRVQLEPVAGRGQVVTTVVDKNGRLRFGLPGARSFGVWRYKQ